MGEVFRFDLTLPVIESDIVAGDVAEEGQVRIYRRSKDFTVDVPALVSALRDGMEVDLENQSRTRFEFVWRLGAGSVSRQSRIGAAAYGKSGAVVPDLVLQGKQGRIMGDHLEGGSI